MKEHPIIFTTELIPKILDGTKTQTRRVVKPQPEIEIEGQLKSSQETINNFVSHFTKMVLKCPYGQVGDVLWVRETFREATRVDNDTKGAYAITEYKASHDRLDIPEYYPQGIPKWQSPLFMSRYASRITLEITGIRVERLQEITRQDAILEGYPYLPTTSEIDWYYLLWNSLNAKYSWEANPWVWCISFKKVDCSE